MEEGYLTPAPDYNAPDPVPQAPAPEPSSVPVPPVPEPEPAPVPDPAPAPQPQPAPRQPERPDPAPSRSEPPKPAPSRPEQPRPVQRQPEPGRAEQPPVREPLSIPPHRNMMAWSILITLFCCLLGGIIAIVQSSQSNRLYNNSLFTTDPSLRQSLYLQSEAKNRSARGWIWASIIAGFIPYAVLFVAFLMALAEEI